MHTLIIGAGAAGCVVAERLSRDPHHRVTLVEAGPDHPDPSRLPADLADGDRNSMRKHDWGLRHRPNQVRPLPFPFPRGKVVGGSSAVNTCIAVRGTPEDFDEWGALGLPDWSWEQCLPAFRAIERDLDHGDDPWHGSEGPLPLRRPRELARWQGAFLEAGLSLGHPYSHDHNAPDGTGVGPHAFNKLDSRRISAAEAWLTPQVRLRPNLHIRADTLTHRVRLRDGRARGVDVSTGRRLEQLSADRVVLCAGAIHTPGLLLRSGVGPAADLARLGIRPRQVLPAVGRRLLDHPGFAIFFRPNRGVADRADPLIQVALRTRSTPTAPFNDLQVQAGSNLALRMPVVPFVTIMGHVGKPVGHGLLRYTSADPRARPRIRSRFFEETADLEVALTGMELALSLWQSPPMRTLARPLWPSLKVLTDRKRLTAFLRKTNDSGYHPCGTVPMGPASSPDAATDGRGAVHGLHGLYVADASLMPTVPTGNIHLPTLMVAHRIAGWLALTQRM